MQNNKLIKTLRALNKEEFKYLGWFVKSDYFNTDKNLVRLYKVLGKYYPAFESKGLGKEVVFGKVFLGAEWSDIKMRNLMSKMITLLNDYLICEHWKKDNEIKERLLIEAYENMELDYNEYRKKTLKLIDHLEKKSVKGTDDFFKLFQLNKNLYFHPKTPKIGDANSYLMNADKYLELFRHSFKLIYSCEFNVKKNVQTKILSAKQFDFSGLDELLGQSNVPSIEIYLSISKMQKLVSYKSFLEAKNKFLRLCNSINKLERHYIFQLLLNFAIFHHNKGERNYPEEIFNLYKFGLSERILIENNRISDATYSSIVSLASSLGEVKWAKWFMERHEIYLNEKNKAQTKVISWGYWHFHQGNFPKTVEILHGVIFKTISEKVRLRMLLIRCYFDLFLTEDSYYSTLDSYAIAFKKFAQRSKELPKSRSIIILNYISEIKKMAKYKYKDNITEELKKQWTAELIKNENIVAKKWLLQKIREI